MVDYPTDLDLTSDRDIHLDGGNDLATTSGLSQLEQSVGIDVLDATQEFVGEPLTGQSLGLLEERLRQSLNQDEQLDGVTTVNVEEYDRRTGSVTFTVVVSQDEDFTITVTE